MKLAALFQRIRLAETPQSRGLSCTPQGLSLAGVSLLEKTARGLAPRPAPEIAALIMAAYGATPDLGRLSDGLRATAKALNDGDLARAMVAALHLRLPEMSGPGAMRVAEVGEYLAKYSADQPRDWHGRWTTEGGDQAPARPGSASPRPSTTRGSTWRRWASPRRPSPFTTTW